MNLIYNNGEVNFNGLGVGFELKYKGSIKITDSPDNLFISANKSVIIGIMLDGSTLPKTLFSYEGECKFLHCNVANVSGKNSVAISFLGVDFWEYDNQNWEDDSSFWGEHNKTFLVGKQQVTNRHERVVNKNLTIKQENQFIYNDGTPVPKNTKIHIHADGVVMTGGVHTPESVQIFYKKERMNNILQKTTRAIKTNQTAVRATSKPSASGGGY